MDTLVQCNNCQCKHNNRELFKNGGFCLLDNIQLYNGMCICAEAEFPNKWIKIDSPLLSYGETNKAGTYISFQYHELMPHMFRVNDIITKAHYMTKDSIYVKMDSGDIFVVLDAFDNERVRIDKII